MPLGASVGNVVQQRLSRVKVACFYLFFNLSVLVRTAAVFAATRIAEIDVFVSLRRLTGVETAAAFGTAELRIRFVQKI